MRRFPISWDRTLTALGFRRRVSKLKKGRHYRDRVRLEWLERREMLAGDTPIVLRPEYVIVSNEDAAPPFLVSTIYDASGSPSAVVTLDDEAVRDEAAVHELRLELRLAENVLETQVITVNLAQDGFQQAFYADRKEAVSKGVRTTTEAELRGWVDMLLTEGEFSDVVPSEAFPSDASRLIEASSRLAAIAHFQETFTDLLSVGNRRAAYYNAVAVTAGRVGLLADAEAAQRVRAELGRVALLGGEQLATDLTGPYGVAESSLQARDSLLQTVSPYYTVLGVFSKNIDLQRSASLAGGMSAVSVVEEGVFTLGDRLRVELGEHRAFVGANITLAGAGSQTAALNASYAGATYVDDSSYDYSLSEPAGETANSLLVERSSSQTVSTAHVRVDLTEPQNLRRVPLTATLTVEATDANDASQAPPLYLRWDADLWNTQASYEDWVTPVASPRGVVQGGLQSGEYVFDVSEAVQRSLLFGDANADGKLDHDYSGSPDRRSLAADVNAIYLAIRDWDSYEAQYGSRHGEAGELIYRVDGNLDGLVRPSDGPLALRRLGIAGGDFNLDGARDTYDLALYQANYGKVAHQFADGDADFNGVVNAYDHAIWNTSYVNNEFFRDSSPRFELFFNSAGALELVSTEGGVGPKFDLDYGSPDLRIVDVHALANKASSATADGKVIVELEAPYGALALGDASLQLWRLPAGGGSPIALDSAVSLGAVSVGGTLMPEFSGAVLNQIEPGDQIAVTVSSTVHDFSHTAILRDGIVYHNDGEIHVYSDGLRDTLTVNEASVQLNVGGAMTITANSSANSHIAANLGGDDDVVDVKAGFAGEVSLDGGQGNDTYFFRTSGADDRTIHFNDTQGTNSWFVEDIGENLGKPIVEGINQFDPRSTGPKTVELEYFDSGLSLVSAGTYTVDFKDEHSITHLLAAWPSGEVEPQPVLVNVLVVDTLEDVDDDHFGPNEMSLREALRLAAENPYADASYRVEIKFAPELFVDGSKTISLTNGAQGPSEYSGPSDDRNAPRPLAVGQSVQINGPGSDLLTIDGGGDTQVIKLKDNSGLSVALRDLAVANGWWAGTAGGPNIHSIGNASLLLERLEVYGGAAPNSFASGGAVYTANTNLEVRNSYLHDNSAYHGGGIGVQNTSATYRTLVISGSTIAENTSSVIGGGIALVGAKINTSIVNSTISGNESKNGAGVWAQNTDSTTSIVNSTIAGNTAEVTGGGIRNQSSTNVLTLTNSIVAGNLSLTQWWSQELSGAIDATSSYNLIQHAGSSAPLANGVNHNIVGVNAKLTPLGHYGGPTPTHALLADSPAIDAGDAVAASTDQRGYNRLRDGDVDQNPGAAVDIGAYEYYFANPVEATVPFLPILEGFDGDSGAGKFDFTPGGNEVGYLQFDLTAQLAEIDTLVPELRLWVDVPAGVELLLSIKAADDAWNESDTSGATPGLELVTVTVNRSGFVTISGTNLTEYVRSKLRLGQPISVAIVATLVEGSAPIFATVRARHHGSYATRPRLVVSGEYYNNAVPSVTGTTPDLLVDIVEEAVLPTKFVYGNVLKNDGDPNGAIAFKSELVDAPKSGRATLSADGDFTYQANYGASGLDEFTYKVFDGFSWSAPQRVKILIHDASVHVYQFGKDDLSVFDSDKVIHAYLAVGLRHFTMAGGDHPAHAGYGGPIAPPTPVTVNVGKPTFEHVSLGVSRLGPSGLPYDTPEWTFAIASRWGYGFIGSEEDVLKSQLSSVYKPYRDLADSLPFDVDRYIDREAAYLQPDLLGPWSQATPFYSAVAVNVTSDFTSAVDGGESYRVFPGDAGGSYGYGSFPGILDEQWGFDKEAYNRNQILEYLHTWNGWDASVTDIFDVQLIVYAADVLEEKNNKPKFTSTPATIAKVGEQFSYTMTGSDVDDQTLYFESPVFDIVWPADLPEGYDPVAAGHVPQFVQTSFERGNERAVFTWTPPKELSGKTIIFTERITDGIDSVPRTFSIAVQGTNAPPIIVANPRTDYHTPVDAAGLPEAIGEVTPSSIVRTLADGESVVERVSVKTTPEGLVSQIVFVVDQTGSMQAGFDWLQQNIASIDQAMVDSGFRTEYGLIYYEATPSLPPGTMAEFVDLSTFINWITPGSSTFIGYAGTGAKEAGYDALDLALQFPFFEIEGVISTDQVAAQVVLITDDRDTHFGVDDATHLDRNDPEFYEKAAEIERREREAKAAERGRLLEQFKNSPESEQDDITLTIIGSAGYAGRADSAALPPGVVNPISGDSSWEHGPEGLVGVSDSSSDLILNVVDARLDSIGRSRVTTFLTREKAPESIAFEFSLLPRTPEGFSNGFVAFDYKSETDYKYFEINIDAPGEGRFTLGEYVNGEKLVFWTKSIGATLQSLGSATHFKVELLPDYGQVQLSEFDPPLEVLGMGVRVNGVDVHDKDVYGRPEKLSESGTFADNLLEGRIGFGSFGGAIVVKRVVVNDFFYEPSYDDRLDLDFVSGKYANALGVTSRGSAYFANGAGGFIQGESGEIVYDTRHYSHHELDFLGQLDGRAIPNFEAPLGVKSDYLELSLATGGSIWDYRILREQRAYLDAMGPGFVDPWSESFAKAYSDSLVEQAYSQVSTVSVVNRSLRSPDASSVIENIDFVSFVEDPLGGAGTLTYDVHFKGDGVNRLFDLEFATRSASGTGSIFGSIPVSITAPYSVDLAVHDADGMGPYKYRILSGPAGAYLQSSGDSVGANVAGPERLIWNPPSNLSSPTEYRFWVTVVDGWGVASAEPFTWSVTVYPESENLYAPTLDSISPESELTVVTDEVVIAPDASERRAYFLRLRSSDLDLDRVRFFLTADAPAGMTLNSSTGAIDWVPQSEHVNAGFVEFTVAISDGRLIEKGLLEGRLPSDLEYDTQLVTSQTLKKIRINVTPRELGNRAPTLAEMSDRVVKLGDTLIIPEHEIDWSDPDGDRPTFSKVRGPEQLFVDPQSGAISWTATGRAEDLVGRHTVTIKIDDNNERSDYATFDVEVVQSNYTPVITLLADGWTGNGAFSLTLPFTVTDRDGETVGVQLIDAPHWIRPLGDPSSDGVYTIEIDEDALNELRNGESLSIAHTFTIQATDFQSFPVEQIIDFSAVLPAIVPPQFEGPASITGRSDREIVHEFSLRSELPLNLDVELMLDADSVRRGAAYNLKHVQHTIAASGFHVYSGIRLIWPPQSAGEYTVVMTAGSASHLNSETLSVVVGTAEVDLPRFTSPVPRTFNVGQAYDFVVKAVDNNSSGLVFGVDLTDGQTSLPGFDSKNIDPAGKIRWTPTVAGKDFRLVLTVFDPVDNVTATKEFLVDVLPRLSQAPVIVPEDSPPVLSGMAAWTYILPLIDDDPSALRLTLNDEAIAAGLRLLAPTSQDSHVDEKERVKDGRSGWALVWDNPGPAGSTVPLMIDVLDPGTARLLLKTTLDVSGDPTPTLPEEGDYILEVGRVWRYATVTGYGSDEYRVEVAVDDGAGNPTNDPLPPGLAVVDNEIRWNPEVDPDALAHDGSGDLPVYGLLMRVVDAETGSPITGLDYRRYTFEIVRPTVGSSSTLTIDRLESSPPLVHAGSLWEFVPPDTLLSTGAVTWTLEKGPADATFNRETGRLQWRPATGDIGKRIPIAIRAVDSSLSSDLIEFSITVLPPRIAPTIGATFPLDWKGGETLSFDLRGWDPAGSALTYQILDSNGDLIDADGTTPTASGGVFGLDGSQFEWTPSTSVGVERFIIRAYDPNEPAISTDLPVTVRILTSPLTASGWEPVIQGSLQGRTAFTEDSTPLVYEFGVLSADNASPTQFVVHLVDGVAFDNSPGGPHDWINVSVSSDSKKLTVTLSPDAEDRGLHTIRLKVVANGAERYLTTPIVVEQNSPPEVTAPERVEVVEGTFLAKKMPARDPEGGGLFFYLDETAPDWLSVNHETGVLTGLAPIDPVDAEVFVSLHVVDSSGRKSIHLFELAVQEDNVGPSVSFYIVDTSTGRIVSPSESLDAGRPGDYKLWIEAHDNVSSDANIRWSLEAEDSLALNDSVEEPPVAIVNEIGGRWSTTFTSLNQGLIYFNLTAHDDATSQNSVAYQYVYYADLPGQTPTAKLLRGFDSVIDSSTEIDGYASFSNSEGVGRYRLKLTSIDDRNDFVWVVSEGELADADVVDGVLGTIDPTLFRSGHYRLYLEVLCPDGCLEAIDERIVEIRNDSRLGNLELSFTDLQVDLGGLPVALVRSYSSAMAGVGDAAIDGAFGPGWTLNFLEAGVSVSHREQITQAIGQPLAAQTRLSVELPDGTIERFSFAPVALPGGSSELQPYFRPDAEVTSTLELVGADELRLVKDSARGDRLFADKATNRAFVLRDFAKELVLTTRSGVRYLFDTETGELTGIQSETGLGVAVTRAYTADGLLDQVRITPTGGESSSGDGVLVQFEQFRIDRVDAGGTALTTPLIVAAGDSASDLILNRVKEIVFNEKSIKYHYGSFDHGDALPNYSSLQAGDAAPGSLTAFLGLGVVENRAGERTTLQYNAGDEEGYYYHLTHIFDASGVAAVTAEYYGADEGDKAGRLKSLTDAGGSSASVSFDLELGGGLTLTTVVDEGTGQQVEEIRNKRGDVKRRMQLVSAVGEPSNYVVTVYEHDNQGRVTHESLPFVVVSSDLEERANATPPLVAADEPDSAWARITTYDPDGRGLVVETRDAYGAVTTYDYDDQDRLVVLTDPNGVVSHSVYDLYTGDLLETYVTVPDDATKYSHSRFEYENGRVTATYQIDGDQETLLSETSYNSGGRVEWTKDARGNKRYFHYNDNGEQTHSWSNWTDGTTYIALVTKTEYDDEGRVRETFEYEVNGSFDESEINALLTAISAGALVSSSETVYEGGRVERVIDHFGAQTINHYDKRGALVQTQTTAVDRTGGTDTAGWIVTRTVYDEQGRIVFATDPFFVGSSGEGITGLSETWTGSRTVYDHLGREEARQRWSGVEVRLTVSDVSGLYNAEIADVTDWDNPPPGVTLLSSSQTYYDDFGRVIATESETLARTDYYYDAAGRQVAVLGPIAMVDGSPQRALSLSVFDATGRLTQLWNNLAVDGSPAPTRPELVFDGSRISGEDAELLDRTDVRITSYEYDRLGRQTAVITPLVDHDQDGGAANPTPRVHLRSETQYDALGRRVSTTEGIVQPDVRDPTTIDRSAATTTKYEYNETGDLIAVTLPPVAHSTLRDLDLEGVPKVRSDAWGAPVTVAAVVSPRYEYVYDNYGNRIEVIDNILVTSDGRIFRDHDAYHSTTSNGLYGPDGVDEARVTRFAYDQHGRQVSRKLPLGVLALTDSDNSNDDSFTETMQYGETELSDVLTPHRSVIVGQLTSTVDFEGRQTQYYYDNSATGGGRLVEKRYTDGSTVEVVTYRYDAFGRQTEVQIDRDNDGDEDHTTLNVYDGLGRLKSVSTSDGALQSTIHYAYSNATDQLIRTWTTNSSDPDAAAAAVLTDTRYVYDDLNRLSLVLSHRRDGSVISDATPSVGAHQWKNETGATTMLDGDATHYAYDLLGNLERTETQHASGAELVATDYAFDELGRLIEQRNYRDSGAEGYVEGQDTLYGYYAYQLDEHGARIGSRQIDDQGKEIAFEWLYDNLGRLVGESVDYDTTDADETDGDSNDSYTHYIYDPVGNRIQKLLRLGDEVVRPSAHGTHYSLAVAYAYDANDRLLSERQLDDIHLDLDLGSTGEPVQVELVNSDDFWRAYDFGSDNEIRYTPGEAIFYAYGVENSGTQRTSKTIYDDLSFTDPEPSNGGIATTYSYNVRGMLEQTSDGSTTHVYQYNDDGVRIRQTVGSETTNYTADQNNPTGYSQVIEERNTSNNVTNTFVVGHDLLRQQTHEGPNAGDYQLLYDGHGSTRTLLSVAGANLAVAEDQRYLYDAYGALYKNAVIDDSRSGLLGYISEEALALTAVLYAGEWVDKNGLGYNRARYLDFSAGVWTSLDPFAGNDSDPQSLHKYAYVHGNPVNGIDPTGEFVAETLVVGVLLGVVLQTIMGTGAALRDEGISQLASGNLDLFDLGFANYYNGSRIIALGAHGAQFADDLFNVASNPAEAALLLAMETAEEYNPQKGRFDSSVITKSGRLTALKTYIRRTAFSARSVLNGTGLEYVVYQRNIDWSLKVNGISNLQLARSGKAPFVVKNGRIQQVQLHHSRQNGNGPLFEIAIGTHTAPSGNGRQALHPYLPSKHPEYPVDYTLFKRDKEAYWMNRARLAQLGS
jgi:RHS repeat-associated protein